jgi:cation diffusion facilitator CzcD-associated flavoprotein CzcO
MSERSVVLVIGTGFSGLCSAIRLKQEGINDFVILARAEGVGGTWRDNHDPGCACDVPSHLYSFSFEQNPDWSRQFAPQPEIFAYLRRYAEKYGILPHVRFNANVVSVRFDEATSTWVVSTADGREFRGQVLVSGRGALSKPFTPDTPGLESFQGEVLRSAHWRHDVDLRGKRNRFFLMGPNTGLGHSSMVCMIGAQVNDVMDAVRTMKAKGAALVDVRREVQAQFVRQTPRQLVRQRESGKNTTPWPGLAFRYRAATSSVTPSDYVIKPPRARLKPDHNQDRRQARQQRISAYRAQT